MISITIGTNPKTGADLASWEGFTARSSGGCAARTLARMLMDADIQDQPLEARGRDGKLRYTVRRLHAFAGTRLVENPHLMVRPYDPDAFSFVPQTRTAGFEPS